MAAPNPANVLYIPGRLCRDPTDLSTAFPHGGTALGLTKMHAYNPNARVREIRSEEWGGAVSRVIRAGQAPTFACVLREWDTDAVSAVFPEAVTGASSGKSLVQVRSDAAFRAGHEMPSMVLLFSPLSPDHAPSLLFYRAVPDWDATARVRLALNEPAEFPVVFRASPDSSGRLCDQGLREDMTL